MSKRLQLRDLNVKRCLLLSSPIWLAAAASQGLSAQTTLSVSNVTQLRAAISTVNGDSNDYIIEMQSGTYVLTGAAGENANASGDLDLVKAAGTVAIQPASGATVIVDANGVDRVFHFNNGVNAPITLSGFTIQGGVAVDDGTTGGEGRGGAILKEGAGSLNMQNMVVSGNTAKGADGVDGMPGGPAANGTAGTSGGNGLGGGLYLASGNVNVTGGNWAGNAASGGKGGNGGAGGPQAGVTAGNGGDGAFGGNGHGGAVYLAGGQLTIDAAQVSSNSASGGDGGDGGDGGAAQGFPGNGGTAFFGGAGRGGAFYVNSGTLMIDTSTLDQNAAAGGVGGIGGAGGGGITGTSGRAGQVGANGGSAQGGAIFGASGTVSITDSTISNCTADGGDGGSGGDGGTGVNGGNGGAGGLGGFGHSAGVFVQNASITILQSTLSGNSAQGGDGGDGGDGGTAIAVGGNGGVGGGAGQSRGGAIYVRGTSITIQNSTVAASAATSAAPGAGGASGGGGGSPGSGGAASSSIGGGTFEDASSGAATNATSTIFADNTAASNPDAGGTLNATNCLIENGVTPSSGSGNVTGTDPALGSLQNNGGPTLTHAIAGGSAARNAGSNPQSLTTDQRGTGFTRDDGSGVDIGAYEFNGTALTNPPTVSDPGAAIRVNAANYAIMGSAPPNSLVRIYEDVNDNGSIDVGTDMVVGSQQLTGGGTAYSIAVALAQNTDNNFLATADDGTSGESIEVNVPTITEDSIAPSGPVVTTPAAPINTTGTSFAIGGTAEADALLRVYIDFNNDGIVNGADAVVGSQQLTGGGTNWSINTPITQSTTNNFVVTAVDGAGNESSAVNVPTITETTAPAISPPVISDPTSPVSLDAPSYTITGTAQPDSLVRIYSDLNDDGFVNGGDAVVAMQQLTGGAIAFAIPTTLAPGVANNFLATAEDASNNESLPTDVPTITETNPTSSSGGGGGGGGGCSTGESRWPGWALLGGLGAALLALLRSAFRRSVGASD
ncbi:MAG: hypothetical protein H6839_15085 [Planctomycetes bacterium]|nr:hypothetical protein [Planctomycetota bacterium]